MRHCELSENDIKLHLQECCQEGKNPSAHVGKPDPPCSKIRSALF